MAVAGLALVVRRVLPLLSAALSLGALLSVSLVWGHYQAGITVIIAATGVILTAGYILWMIQRVYLGKQRSEYAGFPEATGREILVLAPMAVLAVRPAHLPVQGGRQVLQPLHHVQVLPRRRLPVQRSQHRRLVRHVDVLALGKHGEQARILR
jgi:NADH:ubiquinone oxidoreductase subunit 5 (subunit L)/multisubunit Na+/H+ antiporter MnhA subunit